MHFCPKCGSLMKVTKIRDKKVLKCPKCGYVEETQNTQIIAYKEEIKHSPKEKTILVESSNKEETLPKIKGVICPKCGNDEAYWWVLQTRRADEPPTRFYRCTKCGHVWREYE